MKRFISILVVALSAVFGLASQANAIVDPLNAPNNRFGIHIIDENDLEVAAQLVNSQGGEWGYVTVVIREDDRNHEKWQKTFDRMRGMKLIPLVRLATRPEGSNWIKPRSEDVEPWVDFLNNLNWPTRNRYTILFNEPNHAKEWGGQIKPDEYTQIANLYIDALKNSSDDFFVLPAGLDLAASNTLNTMSAANYFVLMHQADNTIFQKFDGWTSHSYPNPAFSGSPSSAGRATIRGFNWETNFLQSYGLDPALPIFITETGWVHSQGQTENKALLSPETVASHFKTAFTQVWNSDQIVAVTPFLLNYPAPPFDHFSFIDAKTREPLPHFQAMQEIPKTAGKPIQIENAQILQKYFPTTLIADHTYNIRFQITNTGQSIWDSESHHLKVVGQNGQTVSTQPLSKAKPGDKLSLQLNITTPSEPTEDILSISLYSGDKKFGPTAQYAISVQPETNFGARIKVWIEQLIHRREFVGLSVSGIQVFAAR